MPRTSNRELLCIEAIDFLIQEESADIDAAEDIAHLRSIRLPSGSPLPSSSPLSEIVEETNDLDILMAKLPVSPNPNSSPSPADLSFIHLVDEDMGENVDGLYSSVNSYLEHLTSVRFVAEKEPITKQADRFDLLLHHWYHSRPEIFRDDVRVYPWTFTRILSHIEGHPVFQSGSNVPQAPPNQQLILFLYRMGHSGNASSLAQISKTFGVSQGHVVRSTARVLKAVLDTPALMNAIGLPAKGSAEREDAKRKMEEKGGPEWRDGWLVVDGTLIPLACRPTIQGESFFDRKKNYSINLLASLYHADILCIANDNTFQIFNTADRRIVDFNSGFVGSRNDASCFAVSSQSLAIIVMAFILLVTLTL